MLIVAPCAWWSRVAGEGHNPDAVASVKCAKVGSRYAVPFRIIPERGQGSENVSKPSTKQCCDVFQDDISGCQFANQTGDLVEQTAALSGKPCAFACGANVLAGEAAADDINGNSIGSKLVCGKFSHVSVARNVWPVLGEDAAREVFNFAERDCFKAGAFAVIGCPFQPQREAAYSRKKIKNAQLAHCLLSSHHAIQRPNTVAAQIDSANHATTATMIMVAVMLLLLRQRA
jgi:hypothetical protein